MAASNPFNPSQNTYKLPTPAAGTSVPRGYTTNAAAPTPEAYQYNINAQNYNPINLTSGLYEGVGAGNPFFYQSKSNPNLYSTRKDEISLGGDMYAKLNPEWAKSIGGREGGLGWEFDFDPTSQLYGNESNALMGRRVESGNSLKSVGGELLRMATIPAMAYGVAGLQGAGILPTAGSGGLQPITGAAAPGLQGAASTGVGTGASTGAAAGGMNLGIPAYTPAMNAAGMASSGAGAAMGIGGQAGTAAAATAAAGANPWSLSSLLGSAKTELAGVGANIAANPLKTALGLGQGLLQYQQGQDLLDIARKAAEGNRALAEPERQQYQQLLSQYFSGGQDITEQPMVAAALRRAKAENEAQLAKMGMTQSGRALTSVADYTNDVFNKNALPYLSQLAGQGGFGFGPSGAGSTYGGIASQATGANNQAWGSLINGLTNPNPSSQPWWWHANNAQNQMTQIPGAGTYMRMA